MIKNLNYILILITLIILAAIGVIFIVGSGYSWSRSLADPQWQASPAYANYIAGMNLGVVPLTVALVIILGLCIPKRLFSGTTLLQFMGALLLVTMAAVALLGFTLGAGFLLAAAMIMQLVVIGLTAAGSKRLSYEVQGFYLQVGSALLHLGLILFLFDFIVLANSPAHVTIFWVCTAFITLGMVLSFYSPELSARKSAAGPAPAPAQPEPQTE